MPKAPTPFFLDHRHIDQRAIFSICFMKEFITLENIMPRFFFDIADGGLTIDETGHDFATAQEAAVMATRTLPDIARDYIGDGRSRELVLLIRDDSGKAIFAASLSLTAKWLVESA